MIGARDFGRRPLDLPRLSRTARASSYRLPKISGMTRGVTRLCWAQLVIFSLRLMPGDSIGGRVVDLGVHQDQRCCRGVIPRCENPASPVVGPPLRVMHPSRLGLAGWLAGERQPEGGDVASPASHRVPNPPGDSTRFAGVSRIELIAVIVASPTTSHWRRVLRWTSTRGSGRRQ